MNKRRITIRLNPEKERDREIISYLDTFGKGKHGTVNNAVLNAVYDFLKNRKKAETEKISNPISDIMPEIRKAISEELSKFIIPIFRRFADFQNCQNPKTQIEAPTEREEILDPDDADMDYIGG